MEKKERWKTRKAKKAGAGGTMGFMSGEDEETDFFFKAGTRKLYF
jgi:hypothetical protein